MEGGAHDHAADHLDRGVVAPVERVVGELALRSLEGPAHGLLEVAEEELVRDEGVVEVFPHEVGAAHAVPALEDPQEGGLPALDGGLEDVERHRDPHCVQGRHVAELRAGRVAPHGPDLGVRELDAAPEDLAQGRVVFLQLHVDPRLRLEELFQPRGRLVHRLVEARLELLLPGRLAAADVQRIPRLLGHRSLLPALVVLAGEADGLGDFAGALLGVPVLTEAVVESDGGPLLLGNVQSGHPEVLELEGRGVVLLGHVGGNQGLLGAGEGVGRVDDVGQGVPRTALLRALVVAGQFRQVDKFLILQGIVFQHFCKIIKVQ